MSAQTTRHIRLMLALFLSPVVAAAIAAIVIGLLMGSVDTMSACYEPPYEPSCGATNFGDMLQFVGAVSIFGGVMGGMIGWPAMLIGGLPVHAYLARKNQTRLWIYTVLGLIIGSLAMFAYFSVVGDLIDLLTGEGGWLALSGPLSGGLAAGLFWLIRRPDQMSPT